jgi:hypothetical protein
MSNDGYTGAVDQLAAALAKTKFARIEKTSTVMVQSRSGSSYKFSYAPLENIMSAVRGPLAENGLSLSQTVSYVSDGVMICGTTLLHESGQQLTSLCPVTLPSYADKDGNVRKPTAQEVGSAISYARRYGVTLALCLVSDEDDDGNIADGNKVTKTNTLEGQVLASNARPLADAGNGLSDKRKSELTDLATHITEWHGEGKMDEAYKIAQKITDNDEKIFLWSLLNSKVRAAIKFHSTTIATKEPYVQA